MTLNKKTRNYDINKMEEDIPGKYEPRESSSNINI